MQRLQHDGETRTSKKKEEHGRSREGVGAHNRFPNADTPTLQTNVTASSQRTRLRPPCQKQPTWQLFLPATITSRRCIQDDLHNFLILFNWPEDPRKDERSANRVRLSSVPLTNASPGLPIQTVHPVYASFHWEAVSLCHLLPHLRYYGPTVSSPHLLPPEVTHPAIRLNTESPLSNPHVPSTAPSRSHMLRTVPSAGSFIHKTLEKPSTAHLLSLPSLLSLHPDFPSLFSVVYIRDILSLGPP